MPRCEIHELLPYGGESCTDCRTDDRPDAEVLPGPWRAAVAASTAEEPEPYVVDLG